YIKIRGKSLKILLGFYFGLYLCPSPIIMVLHDINQALTYSDELICVANGEIAAQGKPQAIVTPELLKTIYQIDAKIIHDKDCGILIGKCHGGC
ncbi:MAG: ABC transporter ATP-binding protein, partial [Staphylococcus simulans]|nr:ABC transporter ATP-binding protein [Staphylococcus simulans]MDK8316919.1 ABC transporter ATP-binding protein [Staphylococcus simulans]